MLENTGKGRLGPHYWGLCEWVEKFRLYLPVIENTFESFESINQSVCPILESIKSLGDIKEVVQTGQNHYTQKRNYLREQNTFVSSITCIHRLSGCQTLGWIGVWTSITAFWLEVLTLSVRELLPWKQQGVFNCNSSWNRKPQFSLWLTGKIKSKLLMLKMP